MISLLDNVAWNTLQGHHANHAEGGPEARRYARGFSPIIAFPDPASPDFRALAHLCGPDEPVYLEGWRGKPPGSWEVVEESSVLKMVWAGGTPTDEAGDATLLRLAHAGHALELISLTRPGPFGPRTLELGNYFGHFEGARLVAMAGERMFAGSLREISGVCTHPGFEGRGFARKLMNKLIGQQLRRGETPFLHVASGNERARSLYERMGFRRYQQTVVRVVSRMQA